MAHQGLKQHIDLCISRLATYQALCDEIDPNAMHFDAVNVNVNQERQGSGSGSRSDTGKGCKGGKGKSKKGGPGQGER